MPVPWSLANVDISINKGDKVKLSHKLEATVEHTQSYLDATVVDAMFLLYSISNLLTAFGGVAEVLLSILCEMSSRVDLVCDTYSTPSIKDIEHNRRESEDSTYLITGPQQALKSPPFKESLFRLLDNEWDSNIYAKTILGHDVYIGLDDKCFHSLRGMER